MTGTALLERLAARPPRGAHDAERVRALRRYAAIDVAAREDFELLAQLAAEITGSPHAYVNVVDADEVASIAAWGGAAGRWPRDDEYCAWAVAEPRGLHIPDLGADPRTWAMPDTGAPWRMYAGANLVTPDGHRIGTLCVLDTQPRRLPAHQQRLLERLAAQVMALLELRRHQRELRLAQQQLVELATHDPLTGLANRHGWNAALARETERSARYGAPFAVLVIDVDHFKRVNDRHGHAAGDALLRGLAEQMRRRFRISDTIARLGGEEFAVLLPQTPLPAARGLAMRLRVELARHRVAHDGQTLSVTVSIGVAGCTEVTGAAALLALADQRCYLAKRRGRNRVVATTPRRGGPPTLEGPTP